jgi:hypothetical protein
MYPGFGLSMLDRAVKEFFAVRCSSKVLVQLTEHFMTEGNVLCIYCGTDPATRWDHLHPVSKGGDSSPGNLVPACGRCDDSKQDRTIEEWAASNAKHRPAASRVAAIFARIRKYQLTYAYEAQDFEKKLSPEQHAVYMRFRERLDALREQMRADGLIGK